MSSSSLQEGTPLLTSLICVFLFQIAKKLCGLSLIIAGEEIIPYKTYHKICDSSLDTYRIQTKIIQSERLGNFTEDTYD